MNDKYNLNTAKVLENILEKEYNEFLELEKLKKKNKLDFGKVLSKKELEEILPEIYGEVNNFLEVKNITIPKISYFGIWKEPLEKIGLVKAPNLEDYFRDKLIGYWKKNSFKYFLETLFLERVPRQILIPSIVHEYVHHVQFKNIQNFDFFNYPLREGHARGIEKCIARKYAQKENNPSFLYDFLISSIKELAESSMWIFKETPEEVNQTLLLDVSLKLNLEFFSSNGNFSYLSAHTIGNTIFSICEFFLGTEIYKKSLTGEFKLPCFA